MSSLTKEQLSALWKEILVIVTEREQYFTEKPLLPKMKPPANELEISSLERYLQLSLPPTYRNFISLYNGVENFFYDIPLLSINQIIADEEWKEWIEEWKEDMEDIYPNLDKFIFAGSTETFEIICFNCEEISENGEMEVVHINNHGEDNRWSDFGEFLQNYLEVTQKTVANERADRESLKD